MPDKVPIKCKHRVSLHPKMHMTTGHIHSGMILATPDRDNVTQ